jgi:hypothetical protein
LAYRLSSGIAKVAEVRRVTPEMEIADSTERPVHAPGCNAIIVRLVQDYSLGELTLKALDEAVASELVYSTWIRRRDAYVGNMGYVDGVPMFFDHHIAFDEYGKAQTASEFFRCHDNGGYAGTWTLREKPGVQNADLYKELLELSGPASRAFHFVHSLNAVNRNLDDFAKRIREVSDETIRELIRECGLAGDAAGRVARNLHTTRESLVDDVQLLRQQLDLPAVAG